MHPKLLGCSRPDQYVPCSRSETSTVLMLPCILKDARAIEQRDTWCQYPLHFFLNCLTLSKSLCLSLSVCSTWTQKNTVQKTSLEYYLPNLLMNWRMLTVASISFVSFALRCFPFTAQDTQKDFSTSGKFETAACVYIGNDSPSGLWEESYRSQWEHCILSADQ